MYHTLRHNGRFPGERLVCFSSFLSLFPNKASITIARVHSVHLINADWAQGGRQPSDQANWLGCCRPHPPSPLLLLLSSKFDTPILILPSHGGWKAQSTYIGTTGRVRSPCPRLYIAVAVVINTAASHTAAIYATTRPWRQEDVILIWYWFSISCSF